MSVDPSVVTVSGSDRAALLTDLTLRFGRIDVVSEKEVLLPGGTRGFEISVRHRPFGEAEAEAGAVAAGDATMELPLVADEEAEPPADPEPVAPEDPAALLADAERLLDEARAQAEHALDQAHADADRLRAEARDEAERMVAAAREQGARIVAAAGEEGERVVATQRDVVEAARKEAAVDEERRIQDAIAQQVRAHRQDAKDEAYKVVAEAREEAERLRAEARQELSDARTQSRAMQREAREGADALLREARTHADLATVEGRALAEAVRDAQQRLRELGGALTQQIQTAQKDLADRTSLHGVQARLRAGGAESTAAEIAEHLARLLREGNGR